MTTGFLLGCLYEEAAFGWDLGYLPFLLLGWVPESTSQATGIVKLLWRVEGSSKQGSSTSRGSSGVGPRKRGYSEFFWESGR